MASSSARRARESYTTEQVIQNIFADEPTKTLHDLRKGIRKETRYQRKNCIVHPGLCPAPCFEEFHTAV